MTLSHNNMIALKPVLSAWLDEAEAAKRDPDSLGGGVLPPGEKKRKRTSIAAPEKRSLEAYFAVQPRPSGEKARVNPSFATIRKPDFTNTSGCQYNLPNFTQTIWSPFLGTVPIKLNWHAEKIVVGE